MSKLSKIITLFLLIALVLTIWYSYPIIKNRYFQNNSSSVKIEVNPSVENNNENTNGEDNISLSENTTTENEEEKIEDQEEETTKEQTDLKKEGKIHLEITPQDCDSNCQAFSENDLRYCQEVCGLVEPEKNQDDCERLSGLEKDYCLKDLGIQSKKFSYCDKISDSNIAKTCNNRILEDILEENISVEN